MQHPKKANGRNSMIAFVNSTNSGAGSESTKDCIGVTGGQRAANGSYTDDGSTSDG